MPPDSKKRTATVSQKRNPVNSQSYLFYQSSKTIVKHMKDNDRNVCFYRQEHAPTQVAGEARLRMPAAFKLIISAIYPI